MFITFEGIEGSGKTTQLRRFSSRVSGRTTLVTREPGGTPLAEEIRGLFLRPRNEPVPAMTELFLVLAARASHVAEAIRPALNEGRIVICDRFSDATIAYQGSGRELDRAWVEQACRQSALGLIPDWTILLDLPVEVALERVHRRKGRDAESRIDTEAEAFHRRVRSGYLALAEAAPGRITVIDADRDPDLVAADIDAAAEKRGLFA